MTPEILFETLDAIIPFHKTNEYSILTKIFEIWAIIAQLNIQSKCYNKISL